jgi:hypothetical protein
MGRARLRTAQKYYDILVLARGVQVRSCYVNRINAPLRSWPSLDRRANRGAFGQITDAPVAATRWKSSARTHSGCVGHLATFCHQGSSTGESVTEYADLRNGDAPAVEYAVDRSWQEEW